MLITNYYSLSHLLITILSRDAHYFPIHHNHYYFTLSNSYCNILYYYMNHTMGVMPSLLLDYLYPKINGYFTAGICISMNPENQYFT